MHSRTCIIRDPDEVFCFFAGVHRDRNLHVNSKHLLDFVLHLFVLFAGVAGDDICQMFQLYLIHDLAESFAIELFLQLLCRAGCNADDILRCGIFVVAQPDGEIPLSNIHDDSGSDEQIAALCLALFHLNQSAEWFGLGQSCHILRQYLGYDAVGITLEYHLVRLSRAGWLFPVLTCYIATCQENEYKIEREKKRYRFSHHYVILSTSPLSVSHPHDVGFLRSFSRC